MTGFWGDQTPEDITFPVTVGVSVLVITIVIRFSLYYCSVRTLRSSGGTEYVRDADGKHVVRRCSP